MNVGAAARDAGVPTLTAFLEPGHRLGRPRRARPGGPGRGQQRVRAHPRRRRVHPGTARPGRRRRLGLHRGAAPADADRGEPVRHDLPRALPVLHGRVRDPGAGERRTHARGRRVAAHARRLHPAVGPAGRGGRRAEPAGGRRAGPGEGRRAAGAVRVHRVLRPGGQGAPGPAAVPHRGGRARRDGRRLRRPGQGQHPAQPLRHPARPAPVHGRPQPLQARQVHPGHPHPDPAARADQPPTGRTTYSSSRGTCGPSWSSSCPSCTPGAAGWSFPSRN